MISVESTSANLRSEVVLQASLHPRDSALISVQWPAYVGRWFVIVIGCVHYQSAPRRIDFFYFFILLQSVESTRRTSERMRNEHRATVQVKAVSLRENHTGIPLWSNRMSFLIDCFGSRNRTHLPCIWAPIRCNDINNSPTTSYMYERTTGWTRCVVSRLALLYTVIRRCSRPLATASAVRIRSYDYIVSFHLISRIELDLLYNPNCHQAAPVIDSTYSILSQPRLQTNWVTSKHEL